MFRRLLTLALVLGAASVHLNGQGKNNYLNFEPPENEALAIASLFNLSGTPATRSHYLLIANTNDDSVEVYNAVTNAFLTRIPTGQAPIGVYVKPSPVVLNEAGYLATDADPISAEWTLVYSVNWIGDSVSVIGLRHILRSGVQVLETRVWRTVWVGDEPTSLDFQPEVPGVDYTLPGSPFHEGIVLTHGIAANYDLRDAVTLADFPGGIPPALGNELLNVAATAAVREAWVIKFRPMSDDQAGTTPNFIVLNRRGGNYTTTNPPVQSNYVQINPDPNYNITAFPQTNTNPQYDFDIFGPYQPVGGHTSATGQVGGLGSTNFAMTWALNGDVYVVGQIARNNDQQIAGGTPFIKPNGESLHRGMEMNASGFVQSMIWRVRNIGLATQTVERLDLNAGAGSGLKVVQPTAVSILGDGNTGSRIFVTGFNSDSLAMVTLAGSGLGTSPITRVDLRHATQPFPVFNSSNGRLEGRMTGPRALALLNTPGVPQKLFVLNKIDRSFFVLDPNNLPATPASALRLPLLNDPTPAYVSEGRKFMYSSRLSGNNTSSCAVCHIDGGFDGLSWNLSDPPPPNFFLPAAYPNAAVKGPMFTQSLKGLTTFEVESFVGGTNGGLTRPGQRLFTTEPLHWRGDKGFYEDFNAAFVNLMGMSVATNGAWVFVNPANGDLNRGIPQANMDEFRDFTFSMHYSPNPEQPLDRRFSGDVGPNASGSNIGTLATGSFGGQLGLELYFENRSLTCVGCHGLPAGSNGILTEAFPNPLDPGLPANLIETAALKGTVAKEKRLLRRGFSPPPSGSLYPQPFLYNVGAPVNPPAIFPNLPPIGSEGAVIGEFGLTHTGNNISGFGTETTRHFVHGFINPNFGTVERDALTHFVREFDTGVAPGIGFTVMSDPILLLNPAFAAALPAVIAVMEDQVRLANVGVAVRARINGVERGLRFDLPSGLYVEETFVGPPGTVGLAPISRAQLLANVGGANPMANSLTFIAVPLGAERRFANITTYPTGAVVTANGTVSGITLLPMVPNSAMTRVTTFPKSLIFTSQNLASLAPRPEVTRDAAQAVLMFTDPNGPLFGVPNSAQHQPPRRFCVTGTNILPGAKVRIHFATLNDVLTATPPTGSGNWLPPTTSASSATHEWIEMPLYPSSPDGQNIVWETAAELDPVNVFSFLLGGPQSLISQWYGGSAVYNAAIQRANGVWLFDNFYTNAYLRLADNLVATNQQPNLPTASLVQVLNDIATIQGSNNLLHPNRYNWYWVEIINTIRPTPAAAPQQVVSSGGWQRLTIL